MWYFNGVFQRRNSLVTDENTFFCTIPIYEVHDELVILIITCVSPFVSIQNFQSEISGMCVEGVFTGDQGEQLNMVICEHLFRQGKLDVGERVVQVYSYIPFHHMLAEHVSTFRIWSALHEQLVDYTYMAI